MDDARCANVKWNEHACTWKRFELCVVVRACARALELDVRDFLFPFFPSFLPSFLGMMDGQTDKQTDARLTTT